MTNDDLLVVLLDQPRLLANIRASEVEDDDTAKIIMAMVMLDEENIPITKDSLKAAFLEANRQDIVDRINSLPITTSMDSGMVISHIKDRHNTKIWFHLGNEILKGASEKTANELVELVNSNMAKLARSTAATRMRDAVDDTMEHLEAIREGKTKANYKSGQKIDKLWAVTKQSITVIAAQKKIGKTRWLINHLHHVMNHNSEVDILWFNFEMRKIQMVSAQLAWHTRIDTDTIEGARGPMNDEQYTMVKEAAKHVRNLPVEYIPHRMNIHDIKQEILQRARPNTIVVIDNLGLIAPMPGRSDDIQNENEIAAAMVDIRDTTEVPILLVHHLSKESESKWNKEDMYEPKAVHVRGSSRIVDYANSLILLHRPDKYEDLRTKFGEAKWQKDIYRRFRVDVALNREGPEGYLNQDHDIGCCRFDDRP